jgi:peptidoglycan/xylan/chitin deacetylase (PgdA/CDA1 family)
LRRPSQSGRLAAFDAGTGDLHRAGVDGPCRHSWRERDRAQPNSLAGEIGRQAHPADRLHTWRRAHGPRGRKRIAIGFDDGPSDYTPGILRVLRRFDSHATFFEIGQETAGRASTMKKILAQGNEIGNHSLHHEMDPSSASLHETNRLIRSATGFRPCDFRPPDGAVNSGLISRAHAEHMVTVNWEVDPRDWADPGVSAIASNVIANAHNGSIVVMHDGGGDRSQTVAALPAILSHFRQRGYKFVPVAELLGHQFIYPKTPSAPEPP